MMMNFIRKNVSICMNGLAAIVVMLVPFSVAAQEADVNAGAARAAVCFSCHGEDGVSKNSSWPNLAGQNSKYLVKQMKDFRDGRRQDPTMEAMARPLSDSDIVNISAYYASLGRGESSSGL